MVDHRDLLERTAVDAREEVDRVDPDAVEDAGGDVIGPGRIVRVLEVRRSHDVERGLIALETREPEVPDRPGCLDQVRQDGVVRVGARRVADEIQMGGLSNRIGEDEGNDEPDRLAGRPVERTARDHEPDVARDGALPAVDRRGPAPAGDQVVAVLIRRWIHQRAGDRGAAVHAVTGQSDLVHLVRLVGLSVAVVVDPVPGRLVDQAVPVVVDPVRRISRRLNHGHPDETRDPLEVRLVEIGVPGDPHVERDRVGARHLFEEDAGLVVAEGDADVHVGVVADPGVLDRVGALRGIAGGVRQVEDHVDRLPDRLADERHRSLPDLDRKVPDAEDGLALQPVVDRDQVLG